MNRTRIAFLSLSLACVLSFAGLLVADRGNTDGMYKALGNLAEVVYLIQNDYVDELNPELLSMSLDAGIVESIDRWAAVLPADKTDVYRELVVAPPAFGLALAKRIGSAAVRQAIAGSPAAATDLEAWEVIERVDGVNTRGRPLWQLRLELREKEAAGEHVTLTVVDRRVDERREVVLEPVQWSPTIASIEVLDAANILEIDSLPKGAVDRITELIPDQGPLVIDLRSLAWGLEAEAVAVADLFVEQGLLVGWEGRRAGAQNFSATPGAAVGQHPVVLVGPDTEGVGEVLAAALKRAGSTVVGQRTIGHAPHMRFIEDGDTTLWIPVGHWLRPDGTAISENGIEPDEPVETSDAEGEDDPVLDRALEILSEPLEKAA